MPNKKNYENNNYENNFVVSIFDDSKVLSETNKLFRLKK